MSFSGFTKLLNKKDKNRTKYNPSYDLIYSHNPLGSNDNDKVVNNDCKGNTDNTNQLVSNNCNAVSNMLNQSGDNTASLEDENHEPLMSDIVLLEHELEMLHISRQDNPYLQLLTSQDNLDRDNGDKTDSSSMFSPEPPCSPGNRSVGVEGGGGMGSPLMLEEIHTHLVRSPPPVTWPPVSPRSSAGPFSPDSGSDGNYDFESKQQNKSCSIKATRLESSRDVSPAINLAGNVFNRSTQMVNRSHSEEHILSPSRDVNKKEVFSPVRGATPDFLNAQPNFGYERSRYRSGNLSLATSPRWDMSSLSVMSPGSFCGQKTDYNCQDELKTNNYLRPDVSQSRSGSYSFSRQRSYCGYEGSTAKYSQDCEDSVDEFTSSLSGIDSHLGKRELHSSRPNFYHTMSMYSTCDSKNDDRMGRTESVEDTLLSPTKPTKDNRFPKYSSSNKTKNHRSALSQSASNLLRRSFGRLPFAFSHQQSADHAVSLTPYDFKDNQQPDERFDGDDILESSKTSKTGGNLLQTVSSWRKSHRARSKSSCSNSITTNYQLGKDSFAPSHLSPNQRSNYYEISSPSPSSPATSNKNAYQSWKDQQRNKRKKQNYNTQTYDRKKSQRSVSNDLKDSEAKSLDNLIC